MITFAGFLIRGRRVMLDRDLAELYGVTTTRLNEQVQRNLHRFPSDFMFQLNKDEMIRLSSQIATSKSGRGGRRYAPYVFAEHGAVMLGVIGFRRRNHQGGDKGGRS